MFTKYKIIIDYAEIKMFTDKKKEGRKNVVL